LREESIKAAERWILSKEATRLGYYSAMLNSLSGFALPVIMRQIPLGTGSADRFAIETQDTYRCSPAFRPFGILPGDAIVGGFWLGTRPSCPSSGEWLLSKQILDYGLSSQESVSTRRLGVEFENRFIQM